MSDNILYEEKTITTVNGESITVYINPNVEQSKENSAYGKNLENLPYNEVKEWYEKTHLLPQEAAKNHIVRPAMFNLPFLVQNGLDIKPEDYTIEMWNYLLEINLSKWCY